MKQKSAAELAAKTQATDVPAVRTRKRRVYETVDATNGKRYEVVGKGKVKKVTSLKDLKGVLSEIDLEKNKFLSVLYQYLLDQGETAVKKQGYVQCRMYRMYFGEGGFEIHDMKNFMNLVEDFDNPVPTPREVLDFLRKPQSQKPKEVAAKIKSLKAKAVPVAKVIPPTPREELKKKEATLEEYEVMRKKALTYLKRTSKVENVIAKMTKMFPNRSYNVFLNKLIRKFKNGNLRGKKFLAAVYELTKTISFAPKPYPAPKFIGLPFFDLSELTDNGETVTMLVGKSTMEVSKTELLARFILFTEPKVMPQLMKYLKGNISREDFIANPIKSDKFEPFNLNLLKTKREDLLETFEDLLCSWEIANPANIVYKNNAPDLKKGDKLLIEWPDYFGRFPGMVTSVAAGIRIVYEDGSIFYLLKHQTWKKKS